MADARSNGEREPNLNNNNNNNQTPPPPPPSPRRSPSPNPRKGKVPKDLLPSLSNCHSCDRHFPPRPQTLTDLHPLDSEWRIVLLCVDCLRLVKSATKCSYCFSDLRGGDVNRPFLDCLQCLRRVHCDCIPTEHRIISPSIFDPKSFVCVDCCAIPFGNVKPRNPVTMVSLEGLVRDVKNKATVAVRAKEQATEKVKAAKCAAECAKEALGAVSVAEIDPVVRDEDLALQLHLAMNGSQRISRSGRSMDSGRSFVAKKVKRPNGCAQEIEFYREDKGFLDSLNSSVELGKVQKKESDGCSTSEMGSKEEQGSCSGKVVNSSEDNSMVAGWITYKRVRKSKDVRSPVNPFEKKQTLASIGVVESLTELEQTSKSNQHDRYEKKYSKRNSTMKKAGKGKIVAAHWQTSCLQESNFSNTSLSNLSGCHS